MHLKRIEIQGFKTFAKKTTLDFLPPNKDGHYPLTAVVGPNGSGKSNLSDAIRWALGEQSLKLLRGKDSTDVIFSGSEGKGRAGFAEVSLVFDNSKGTFPLESSEVALTRKLYRSGESEYLVNAQKTRLSDIQLMLAEAGVGQRSYSVVGQGAIDAVLVSSPIERKKFFDDATGVRQFQIKRHQAMLRLKRTYENLAETEMVLREIEPRLRLLRKQVRRLEEREEVEEKLHGHQRAYFGTLWHNLHDELSGVRATFAKLDVEAQSQRHATNALEDSVRVMEEKARAEGHADAGLTTLQKAYRDLEAKRRKIRDEEFQTQKEIELAKVRAQSNWAPLPLVKIIEELSSIAKDQKGAMKTLREAKDVAEISKIADAIEKLFDRSEALNKRLQRPAPEDIKPDPKLLKRLDELKADTAKIETDLKDANQKIENYAKTQKERQTEIFDIGRGLREKQRALHQIEQKRGQAQISLARLEERRDNLKRDLEEALKENAQDVILNAPKERLANMALEDHRTQIERLRYKLELIGGIDPEIIAEYKETQTRYDDLDGQVKDLHAAMKDTEKVVDELDERIHKQSEKSFKAINKEFGRYFKILFGGGNASLLKLTKDDVEVAETEEQKHEGDVNPVLEKMDKDAVAELKKRVKERKDRVVGIEIQATPPGKKLKALGLLSGGERALTSIALLAAIMATNPSPFVLLDEVDAALDEANTLRFATILDELREKTQYIVITHNRATMGKADVLYGVTMNNDGISQLLSVKLEEVAGDGTARR